MSSAIIIIVSTLAQVFSLLIIVDAILSFMMSPLHPIREALGKILNPIYAPIRRILPPMGGIDFTPVVPLFLIQMITRLIVNIAA